LSVRFKHGGMQPNLRYFHSKFFTYLLDAKATIAQGSSINMVVTTEAAVVAE